MTKKEATLSALMIYLKDRGYKRGDKLVPERELATTLSVSRSTLREAVRILEVQGLFVVKRGSGIYLNKNIDLSLPETLNHSRDREAVIKDQLEARFLVIPSIVRYAASRATEEEIKSLQDCIVSMSRAIVSRELEPLVQADMDFHLILAAMTKNNRMTAIMEQINNDCEIYWEYFIETDHFVNNVMFAGYVGIVNALKRKDGDGAAELVRQNVVNACEWFARVKGWNCCEFIPQKEEIKPSI